MRMGKPWKDLGALWSQSFHTSNLLAVIGKLAFFLCVTPASGVGALLVPPGLNSQPQLI